MPLPAAPNMAQRRALKSREISPLFIARWRHFRPFGPSSRNHEVRPDRHLLRAIRPHPPYQPPSAPGGGRGAVRAASGARSGRSIARETRGDRGGLGAASRAGPALSPRCLFPPQQQSVPGHPVRGGEGGAARQPCQEAQVRAADTAGPDVSPPASAFPPPCPARPHSVPPAGSWRR